jgi:hypothetical protein
MEKLHKREVRILYSSPDTKKNEMNRACSLHKIEGECIWGFGKKNLVDKDH